MKKGLTIGLAIVLSVGLIILAVKTYLHFRNGNVEKVTVHIEKQGNKGFLSDSAVMQMVHSTDSIIGRPVKEVPKKWIMRTILSSPYVLSSDVYFTIDGNLVINVKERKPLFRIISNNKTDCYVGDDGSFFPLGKNYVARVMLVNGFINSSLKMGSRITDSTYSKTLLPGIFNLAQQVNKDPFLKAIISQIFVNSKGEVDLIPEVGKQVIRFGEPIQVKMKLENLKAFYQQALVKEGWNKYKEINLKYTNQVVCTK
ncbi:MAG: hypothetical protein JXR71_12785 [Bacteroidales bacterium]|nr:hypothetical protein [Bacteroidales bacterium]